MLRALAADLRKNGEQSIALCREQSIAAQMSANWREPSLDGEETSSCSPPTFSVNRMGEFIFYIPEWMQVDFWQTVEPT